MVRSPTKVTSKAAINRALSECERLGRVAFRVRHGYGESRSYFLRHDGATYDSKAIVGVAFGYQHKTTPLRYDEFSGGAATVRPVLEQLGFTVVASDLANGAPRYPSEWLELGEVYTRDSLREIFGITDATLNNGVFRPKGTSSIWLFVTKEKAADRPQLVDSLDGDVLLWDGQPAGRSDRMLIEHLANGDELLLFYRDKRTQYPNGGFRYEGPFTYRSHRGSKPTAFIFDRDQTALLPGGPPLPSANGATFDPKNVADGRAQVLALVKRRQGQPKFRADLIKAYEGRCAISGCEFPPLLEAAHIFPYRGSMTNHVTNGILLRADLHTLFDLGLIAVNDDGTLDVCPSLKGTGYEKLGPCTFPKLASKRPSPDALEWHRHNVASRTARAKVLAKLLS